MPCWLQLAAGCGELMTALSTKPLRGLLPVLWEELARCRRGYYRGLAHYHVALALLDASLVAAAVAAADDAAARSRLVYLLVNAHSRAGGEQTLRRPVYTDAAVETPHSRLLLGKQVIIIIIIIKGIQCFDAVGWAAGRASGL